MNLSPPLQLAVTQIHRALMVGDQTALVSALENVDLPDLLSQDTLEKVRARGKSALVIFLATLASNNNVEVEQAQFWLECYQSIHQKQWLGALQKLKADNVLRLTLQRLMDEKANNIQAQPLSGSARHWVQAFELAIDHKRWSLANALQLAANTHNLKADSYTQTWLQMSKSLAKRHDLFVDSSGQTHVDTDYVMLSEMYARCEEFFTRLGQKQAAVSLAFLQAKCLEAARAYPKAINILNRILKRSPSDQHASLINMARCECKQGHADAAIKLLDQVIAHQLHNPAVGQDTDGLLTSTEDPKTAKKPFNVANASKALADLATVFEAHSIPFFLVSGTLLGYAREGQLLKHDKDIDVGVLGWEHQYSIGMALQKSTQFSLSADFLKGQKVYYIPISHNETGFIIDLFFYHEAHGKYVTGVDFFFGHQQTFAFSPFELEATEFLGVPMYVPSDVDRNLTENFGNWRVSDPGYISHLEAPCTVDPGGFGHMLTARLQLINALKDHKIEKIRRVLKILTRYQDSAWGMSAELMQRVDVHLNSAAMPTSTTPHLQQEVVHAE